MNNEELLTKLYEIIKIDNTLDRIIAINNFENTYKNTSFYKDTKMRLYDVIKIVEKDYHFSMEFINKFVQTLIDNLSVEKIQSILDKVENMFQLENEDIQRSLNTMKDLLESK